MIGSRYPTHTVNGFAPAGQGAEVGLLAMFVRNDDAFLAVPAAFAPFFTVFGVGTTSRGAHYTATVFSDTFTFVTTAARLLTIGVGASRAEVLGGMAPAIFGAGFSAAATVLRGVTAAIAQFALTVALANGGAVTFP